MYLKQGVLQRKSKAKNNENDDETPMKKGM